jgi:riboflavin synthase
MFTGLVQSLGQVRSIYPMDQSLRLTIESDVICSKANIGDSVAVNGACLTVDKITGNQFEATAVRETLSKTSLGSLKTGSVVNLETALRFNELLGGHLVQGHIDCVGKIVSIASAGESRLIDIEIPAEWNKYMIEHGSIAIDGVSLTLAKIRGNRLTVSVIPHTWERTTLKYSKKGSHVNIEFDYIGKWVEKFHSLNNQKSSITVPWLKSLGY